MSESRTAQSRSWRSGIPAGALGALILLMAASGAAAAPIDLSRLPAPASVRPDFAQDIKPILEAHCYSCHGPEKQRSDFRLDHRAAALKGGQNGTAIIPGKSAESPLIHFVAGLVEDMRMPPPKEGTKALSADQIALLRAWIDQGVSYGETEDAVPATTKSDYWSFRPATRPAPPATRPQGWTRNEIDQFILARLQKEGLSPSPEADKRTLLRRLSFDLTGLPPTPEELSRFLADSREGAYEQEVDRLLGSPRYGERWARHWLDTIHYGETHGYDKDKTRPNAWPYRDYVVRALNSDKPYSQFVEEQLAGDILYPKDPDGVIALGFIAAGPWDFVGHVELPESKTDGLIARYNDRDDMLMTAMSTFQSLTVHCARCHDHKFDPISQEDYYALQAVFAGVDRADRWFDTDPRIFQKRKEVLAEQKALQDRQKALDELVIAASPSVFKLIDARLQDLDKQLTATRKSAEESPSNGFHSQIAEQPDTTKWVQVDLGKSVSLDEIRLIPARPTDFSDTPGFGFPVRFRVQAAEASDFSNAETLLDQTSSDFANPGDGPVTVNGGGRAGRHIRVTATRLWQRTSDFVFALAEMQVHSGGQNVALNATVTAFDSIEAGRWARKFLVDGFNSRKRLREPNAASDTEIAATIVSLQAELKQLGAERQQLVEKLVEERIRSELAEVKAALEGKAAELSALPPVQKVFAAASDFASSGSFKPALTPRPVHVLRRGEVKQPMQRAEPGALSCLPGLERRFKLDSEDREENRRAALAKWITNPANLLTRRSIVNRVWQYHFGKGLVDTPNDFGHMGGLPSHPELLDWLAFWFIDHGESLKQLHRLMLTSATYRQSSAHNVDGANKDADNRFLWRMNRTRLDAESLRDSMLFVAGCLDLTMGGPSVQQFYFKDDHSPVYDYSQFDVESPAALRRSLYRFVVRSVPDPFMETMDCPDASLLAPKRTTTMTALQALALLNDPFVLRQAERCAARLSACAKDLPGQVRAVYELTLSRPPGTAESAALTIFAEDHGLTNLCRLVFNMSEFLFVD